MIRTTFYRLAIKKPTITQLKVTSFRHRGSDTLGSRGLKASLLKIGIGNKRVDSFFHPHLGTVGYSFKIILVDTVSTHDSCHHCPLSFSLCPERHSGMSHF